MLLRGKNNDDELTIRFVNTDIIDNHNKSQKCLNLILIIYTGFMQLPVCLWNLDILNEFSRSSACSALFFC